MSLQFSPDPLSFGSRSLLVRFSFTSRSVLVRSSFVSRSLFVSLSKTERGPNEEQAKNERKSNETGTRKQRDAIEDSKTNDWFGDELEFLFGTYTDGKTSISKRNVSKSAIFIQIHSFFSGNLYTFGAQNPLWHIMSNKGLNRIKVVLVEQHKTIKWLAEQLYKGEVIISKMVHKPQPPSLYGIDTND